MRANESVQIKRRNSFADESFQKHRCAEAQAQRLTESKSGATAKGEPLL